MSDARADFEAATRAVLAEERDADGLDFMEMIRSSLADAVARSVDEALMQVVVVP